MNGASCERTVCNPGRGRPGGAESPCRGSPRPRGRYRAKARAPRDLGRLSGRLGALLRLVPSVRVAGRCRPCPRQSPAGWWRWPMATTGRRARPRPSILPLGRDLCSTAPPAMCSTASRPSLPRRGLASVATRRSSRSKRQAPTAAGRRPSAPCSAAMAAQPASRCPRRRIAGAGLGRCSPALGTGRAGLAQALDRQWQRPHGGGQGAGRLGSPTSKGSQDTQWQRLSFPATDMPVVCEALDRWVKLAGLQAGDPIFLTDRQGSATIRPGRLCGAQRRAASSKRAFARWR